MWVDGCHSFLGVVAAKTQRLTRSSIQNFLSQILCASASEITRTHHYDPTLNSFEQYHFWVVTDWPMVVDLKRSPARFCLHENKRRIRHTWRWSTCFRCMNTISNFVFSWKSMQKMKRKWMKKKCEQMNKGGKNRKQSWHNRRWDWVEFGLGHSAPNWNILVLVRVTCMVQIHPYQTLVAGASNGSGVFHTPHFLRGLQNIHKP